MTMELLQRFAQLKAALARPDDGAAAKDATRDQAPLLSEIERLESEVAALKHALETTCTDRDLLLAHLGGRRPWAATEEKEATVSIPVSFAQMLDDLAGSASFSPDDLAELGRRLEAGDAETMSAADWRTMSFISEKLIAADGGDSSSGAASLAQASNVSRLINAWKRVYGRGGTVDGITLTGLLGQKLRLLKRSAEHGYQAQCLPQIEALLLNLGLGDRYVDETGAARRAGQDRARQTGAAGTDLEIVDLAAHNRSIGILALLDYYLRAQKIGRLPARKTILLCDKFRENEYLVELLDKETIVVDDPVTAEPLRSLANNLGCNFAATIEFDGRETFWAEAMAETYAAWAERMDTPLLQLPDADIQQGYAILQTIGVKPADRFVCLHVRQAGYKQEFEIDSPHNCAIESYFGAMEYLVNAGYRVIRLGDRTMTPLPQLPGVVDFAHSDVRSAFMDIFLIANCEFYIGTSSGPSIVASAFERPAVMTNMQPLIARPPREYDIFLPKLYRCSASGNLLKFDEILASSLGYAFNNSSLFMDRKIEVVDNSPDEIEHAVHEMVELTRARTLAQGLHAPSKSALQLRFDAIPTSRLNYGRRSRISQAFVERHADLLN